MKTEAFATIFVFLPILSGLILCLTVALVKMKREAKIRHYRSKRSQFRIVKNDNNEL